MTYHIRHDNMTMMVYKSDFKKVVNIKMYRYAFKKLCDILERVKGYNNS